MNAKIRITRSQAGRTARLGVLGSRLSLRWLWTRLRARLAPAPRRQAIVDRYHLRTAADVSAVMGNMKGVVMKLGQILSFVSDDVPEEYRAALQQLQANAPPMAFDLVRRAIESELDAPLRTLFADLDPEPLAAASIGQVHRARLPTGEDVVVKVQYPGVDDAIRADLGNMTWLYTLIGMMNVNPGLDTRALADELRSRITEELDYEREARSQQAFADLWAGHPFIRVPAVFPSHSRRRVLTTAFADGHRYDWLRAQPEPLRHRVGEILFRFVFGSIFRFRAFNGDPHPGNYLFHDDGTVTFLDFGCVKYFSRAMVTDWRGLLQAHVAGDRQAVRAHMLGLGFFGPDATVSSDLYYDYLGYFYEPFARDQTYAFTPEYVARSLELAFDRNHPVYRDLLREVNIPAEFALVNRLQWGLYSILGQLSATANWHRIMREIQDGGPTATPLGEADARHRASWRQTRGIPADADVWLEDSGLRWAPRRAVA